MLVRGARGLAVDGVAGAEAQHREAVLRGGRDAVD